MSWLSLAPYVLSIFTFLAGWYLSERRRKTQRKSEIIDDIFPKLIIDLRRGLSTYSEGYKKGYSRYQVIFPYLHEISVNRRIHFIKSIDNELFRELEKFHKEVYEKINALEEIRDLVRVEMFSIWRDIKIEYHDFEYDLSQVKIDSTSLLIRIYNGLFWDFCAKNDAEIQRAISEICHNVQIIYGGEKISINVDYNFLIPKLYESFNEPYEKFLEPFNELEKQMKTKIEDYFIPRLEKKFTI